ncbi:MAG: HDIG domain-containing protein [Desulfuromonadaceae bacterium]|nr:HDIG domain-containing protein [Desulfuromonadaceae bacterium]
MHPTPAFDPIALLQKYYLPHTRAYAILKQHSQAVADKALAVATRLHARHPLDLALVFEGALLHDIGILYTATPSLGCYGQQPYICHGLLGAELLRREGLPHHAQVCENHIGVGLTREDILRQNLPLPHRDMVPETLEQQIIAYADLFFSKNPKKLGTERSVEQVRRSLNGFGHEKVLIFDRWHERFEL